MPALEVLFSPAEFAALAQRDLRGTVCVVFDVLRATSSMVTALGNGASKIIPVSEIADALAIREKCPEVLLAGERDGLRIRSDLTGSIDFDLGNSPREFIADRVRGKTIVMTTTNGTRALKAAERADRVLIGSFRNMSSVTKQLQLQAPERLVVVCSGTHEEASYEDTVAAGALCDRIWSTYGAGRVADSAQIAREIYRRESDDLLRAMERASNGRRLLAMSDLAPDVGHCIQVDVAELVAEMRSGAVIAI